jgi:hypothetical protein
MIESYLAHIEQLLDARRWEHARREASDLPQIAVALADREQRSSPERVYAWCQEWLTGAAEPCATWNVARLAELAGTSEGVPALVLRRLRLHRLARAPVREPGAPAGASHAAQDTHTIEICTALVDATRRWYAQSACHDATVQSNLARLAVLR